MELRRLVELAGARALDLEEDREGGAIAALLRETQGRDAELVALYLCGTLPQGRIGVGWSTVERALGEPAAADAIR